VTDYGGRLFEQHEALLRESAISPEVAAERGYVTADTKTRLAEAGFKHYQRQVPSLLIPVYDEHGVTVLHQHRPDTPRVLKKSGKAVKYETPGDGRMVVDVPPRVRPMLGNPFLPLFVTEGIRKADSAATAGLACVALLGVWSWRGANEHNGKVALAFWESVALNDRRVYIVFDSDVMTKREVHQSLARFGPYLARHGADVAYLYLPAGPGGAKVGLDDWLAAGGTVEDLVRLARTEPLEQVQGELEETDPGPPRPAPGTARSLDVAVKTFRRWLDLPDPAPVYAVAATVVANLAPGDPVWLLVVAPPSTGKTEIVQSVIPLPYVHAVATLTEPALLSGTSARERTKGATGGVLRRIGDFGILLCKDFTSVLSQNRDRAREALAALREVYDGAWDRAVGTDGGQMLSWRGKCGFIAGVTPSYDRYAQVVSALGDRFMLLRLPDVDAGEMATRALGHTGNEPAMRAELADAMTGLIAGADPGRVSRDLTAAERDRLVRLATYTARARTAVERDGYTGELLVIPQPEGTGRIVLQLRRIYGGLEALGLDEETRWTLVARIARDSVPTVRTALIRALLARSEPTRTSEMAAAAGMVTKTAHRLLDDMSLLKLVERTKTSAAANAPDKWMASRWLRDFWPPEGRTDLLHTVVTGTKEGSGEDDPAFILGPRTPVTLLSHSASSASTPASQSGDYPDGICEGCGDRLDGFWIAQGNTRHPDPACEENR